jgi:hypothetical protein
MVIALESAAFWNLTDDDLVDSDTATEQAEGIVSILHDLTAVEKAELAKFAVEYAETEESSGGTHERAVFFRAFPKIFGLED